MRRATGLTRVVAPQFAKGANHTAIAPVRPVGGVGGLVLLSILFWLIFYQNLPNNLEGMASRGPVVLANNSDRIIKITMIAMSLFFIATRWVLTRSLAKNVNVGVAAFLVLAPLSAVWSLDPAATILRFSSLATIFLVCFSICLVRWHPRRFQHVAVPPVMFILMASLLVGMIYPDRITEIGTDISQKGAWHGITHSKNEFGMLA